VRLLAIDTALKACSVAYLDGDAAPVAVSEPMERGHAEALAPMVAAVMTGMDFAALDRIVVTTGPGSFTGLRVGLAFARAMALAVERPCVGVCGLEALALENGVEGYRAGLIETTGGVYFALYRDGETRVAPTRFDVEDVKAFLWRQPGVALRGPGAGAFGGEEVAAPDIVAFARRGATLDPALYRPNPLYLRAPDAKPLATRATAPGAAA
jgi:tRNA threonylcarbamoyladenosine biosynthesis protein TsaB